MFHEVRYYTHLRDRPSRWLLAAGQRRMVRALLDSSTHIYVSIPSWVALLRDHEPSVDCKCTFTWLPVRAPSPWSTLRQQFPAAGSGSRRGAEMIVGSFGMFSSLVAALLAAVLPPLLSPRAIESAS